MNLKKKIHRYICELLGHDWRVLRWGGSTTIPFGDEYICARCGARRIVED